MLQEIFDRVAQHLLKQNERAWLNERKVCAYRTPDGRRCAVGALIADEHYYPDLEFKTINRIEVRQALRKSGIPYEAMSLLQRLQYVHDTLMVEEWRAGLRAVAAEFGLDASKLEED